MNKDCSMSFDVLFKYKFCKGNSAGQKLAIKFSVISGHITANCV